MNADIGYFPQQTTEIDEQQPQEKLLIEMNSRRVLP